MGTTTMDLSEYNAMLSKQREADEEIAKLRQQISALKARPPSETGHALAMLIAVLKPVADFAVANLDPEFIRDWPWEALERASQLVAEVGGEGVRDEERAQVWANHVYRIKKYEEERRLRRRADLDGMPTTSVG